MQIVAKSKLVVTADESAALLATLEQVNAARTWLACEAMVLPVSKRGHAFDLHRVFYAVLRERFGLTAQLVVRALGSVAACFARDPLAQPVFRPHAAIDYDDRILSFQMPQPPTEETAVVPVAVSIATLGGRVRLPLVAGGPHLERLAGKRGASTLLRKGRWYLHTACEVASDTMRAPTNGWLGVDLGIVHLATDSDGEHYTGATIEAVRARILALQSALQAKGTRSARRHLQRLAGREARFRSNTNHVISKRLVAKAQGTDRGIALEDLQGIRDRVTVRKGQRARHAGWAFLQLRTFTTYKAAFRGVPVQAVDPRNTSRTCPVCGCCNKRNRPTRDTFLCIACGHHGPADHVASRNIASRAAANRPIVSGNDHVKPIYREPRVVQGQAPRFSAG